jgi:cytochrome c-type biogenesis protein CcmH
MKNKSFLSALLISAVMLLVFASAASAQDTVPINDDSVNKIAEKLYCPVCENVPLDVCPTKACADWRTVIREMLEEGKSEKEIIAYFSTQYGWNVLPMPPRIGLNWLIYILPPVIIVGAIALLVKLLANGKRELDQTTAETPSNETKNLKDYLAIIDQDLKDNEKNG